LIGDGGAGSRPWLALKLVEADELKSALRDRRRATFRRGIASRRVMLHLRSCYVSKAAILTVPAQPVPVENRSPA